MKRLAVLTAAVSLLAAACAQLPGTPKEGAPPKESKAPKPEHAKFTSSCTFSHRASDDPIVFPGQAGASHSHDFWGNVSTSASSTYDSLRTAPATSCEPSPADFAAYWIPTLLLDGQPIPPEHVTVYYRAGVTDLSSIEAFAPGLMMIAGDPQATVPQSSGIASWGCTEGGIHDAHQAPVCPTGAKLKLQVTFPSCWDSAHLDSPDHRSHMAYPIAGACPDSHPVPVPKVTYFVKYPISGGDVTLSSGSTMGAHGDFVNSWDQAELARRVVDCLRAGVQCGPDGVPKI